MKTPLTDLLGIQNPLIQAPMAGVSTPEMAAAVSNAGGLGSVALGALSAEDARAALAETMALTDRPIAANVFVHPAPVHDAVREAAFLEALRPAFRVAGAEPPAALREIYQSFNDDDDMLEVLLEQRPAAVSLHFGLAAGDRMTALKAAGIRVLATATSVREAQMLAASGVEVLVMQGYGAGGHSGAFLGPPDPDTGGRNGLVDLIRSTVSAIELPVVAAGGLMTSADIRQVLAAGAAGAQLGTAFICAMESLANDAYRNLVATGAPTRLTSGISGRPARGFANELLGLAESLPGKPPDYPLTYDGVKQLIAARAQPGFSVMWAGEGAEMPGQRDLHAAEIIARLGTSVRQSP